MKNSIDALSRCLVSLASLAALSSELSAQAQTLYTFDGDSFEDQLGWAVSGAGDVDGDGFDDLIVGVLSDDDNGTNSGSARVFSGKTGAVLHTFSGDSAYDYLGWAVSGAGEVDGDGYHDLIVGVSYDDNNGENSGSARVFSGRTGAVLHTFNGDSRNDHFGQSVSGAGDVDGDGYHDLIAGTPYWRNSYGMAKVFSGRTGAVLYTILGDANDYLGRSVSGAGDVDGDGFDDFIVGAERDDNTASASGSARVYSGRTGAVLHTFDGDSATDHLGYSVSGAGDVDGDGYADLIAGAIYDDNNGEDSGSARVYSGKTGAVLYTFYGDSVQCGFGYSVSGAGDVDGDGRDDLVVGAYANDNGGVVSGSARVFSGRTGAVLHTFNGDSAYDRFGWTVSGAGDVDGDGFDELIVGAYFDDNNALSSGSASVLSLGLTGTPPRMRTVGHGCPGSNGHLPTIDYRGRAAIGESIDFLLRAAMPNALVALELGVPADLDISQVFPGLPGCRLYVQTDYIGTWTSTGVDGMAAFNDVNLPNDSSLIGIAINGQWACADAAANPLGATLSNGLEMVIGN